jgi:hypothetical protein
MHEKDEGAEGANGSAEGAKEEEQGKKGHSCWRREITQQQSSTTWDDSSVKGNFPP